MATELLKINPIDGNWSAAEFSLAAGMTPVATKVILKEAPKTLWRNKATLGRYAVAPVSQYLRSSATGDTFEEAGMSNELGETLSGLRVLDAASQSQGRGSYVARRAKDLLQVGKAAGSSAEALIKPSRKRIVKAATNIGKVPVGMAATSVDTLKTLGKGIGKGLAADSAGTAAGGLAVLGLAEAGLLNQFGGDTESSVKHAKEFAFTEVGGVTVPEVDPIAAVGKTVGAFQDLSEANQERGYHDDTAIGHGKFVKDEISEEIGGFTGEVVGTGAGIIVGGVVGAAKAPGNIKDFLGDLF